MRETDGLRKPAGSHLRLWAAGAANFVETAAQPVNRGLDVTPRKARFLTRSCLVAPSAAGREPGEGNRDGRAAGGPPRPQQEAPQQHPQTGQMKSRANLMDPSPPPAIHHPLPPPRRKIIVDLCEAAECWLLIHLCKWQPDRLVISGYSFWQQDGGIL